MVYETSVVDCHRIKHCMFSSLFKNSHLMALGYLKDLFVGNAKHIDITKKIQYLTSGWKRAILSAKS